MPTAGFSCAREIQTGAQLRWTGGNDIENFFAEITRGDPQLAS